MKACYEDTKTLENKKRVLASWEVRPRSHGLTGSRSTKRAGNEYAFIRVASYMNMFSSYITLHRAVPMPAAHPLWSARQSGIYMLPTSLDFQQSVCE